MKIIILISLLFINVDAELQRQKEMLKQIKEEQRETIKKIKELDIRWNRVNDLWELLLTPRDEYVS